ncbi:hypothetical protein M409DRAFT_26733 [Zasmidium cellare ATCC 36951]|uniref:Uncharacterized protein n=1 Tax=Zasmidium cellare ATCC 36951 TaxID=1080233 RepID=A0A6A6C9G5_ZASCE|nr:uncharacterized protein M409DRAFT_26733 [Zasmidium cellare ATCC 36951]KAF2162878.1 hypothetical protein M409DRAFT_26733 [Zasmidium cellare ATCC 36951]
MSLTLITAAALLAFTSNTLAEPPTATLAAPEPDYTCTCNGLDAPSWSACTEIANTYFAGDAETRSYVLEGEAPACFPFDSSNELNCLISFCPREGVPVGTNITAQEVLLWYTSVASNCESDAGSPGGICGPGPDVPVSYTDILSVDVIANPNCKQNDAVRTKAATSTSSSVATTLPRARRHSRHLTKDDGTPPSTDNEWENILTADNVNAPGVKINVFGPSPNGSTYTVMDARSTTKSVEASAGLSANLFDIFTASVGISTTYSQTFSEEVGYSVPINCPDSERGVVYWVPLFTQYGGVYLPSNTGADWYIANSGAQTSYEVQCLD